MKRIRIIKLFQKHIETTDFYDPINNIIISTEHGQGGDEININYLNDNIGGMIMDGDHS